MQRWMSVHVGALALFTLLACAVGATSTASAQTVVGQGDLPTSENLLKPLGHLGGPAQATAYRAPYAFVALGNELAVLDLTVSETPTRIGYTQMPQSISDVA